MASPRGKPTIVTVAEAAGVSVTTVSRVVRRHADVHEETRNRVLAVIKELGYRPSPLARALVSGRSRTLGLVVSDITNPFYPQLAKSVEQEAARSGYAVLICNTEDDPALSRAAIERLLDQRIEGIIHGSVGEDEHDALALVDDEVPIVFVNRRPRSPRASYIVVDNVLAARKLTLHLLEQGHRRIGFIGGPAFASNARERLDGFLTAMREFPEPTEPLVAHGHFSPAAGMEHAKQWLATASARPTAIVGVNDSVALGAMEAVLAAGLRVPDDVAVAGFDDIQLAGSALIGLTSVAQQIDEMGRKAVRVMLRMLDRDTKTRRRPTRHVIQPELLVRRTTLAPAPALSASGTR